MDKKDKILIILFIWTLCSPIVILRIIGGIFPIVVMIIFAMITFILANKWFFDKLKL